ncbi:hypothetical protein ACJ6YJ_14850 [Pseudomonas marginalis]|uniref:hypothetical protein n=1 Tax=Pseudomonas TaxID=286 RepID=UPI003899CC00
MNEIINITGLCLNMLGVILLFFWSLPQNFGDANTGRGLEDGTVMFDGRTAGQHRAEAKRKKALAKRMAWIALVLIFVGFLCQFVAAVWPYLNAWIAASICVS